MIAKNPDLVVHNNGGLCSPTRALWLKLRSTLPSIDDLALELSLQEAETRKILENISPEDPQFTVQSENTFQKLGATTLRVLDAVILQRCFDPSPMLPKELCMTFIKRPADLLRCFLPDSGAVLQQLVDLVTTFEPFPQASQPYLASLSSDIKATSPRAKL